VAKRKPGLHKNVSTIFSGVKVPKDPPAEQGLKNPTNNSKNHVILKFGGPGERTYPVKKTRLRFWSVVKTFWPKKSKINPD
jgi:hypothetical protein